MITKAGPLNRSNINNKHTAMFLAFILFFKAYLRSYVNVTSLVQPTQA